MSPSRPSILEAIHSLSRISRRWLIEFGVRGMNCGSGRSLKAGCLNTDIVAVIDAHGNETPLGAVSLCDEGYLYLRHDAARPFPLDDRSVDWVYSEHFIEHLSPDDAIAWLAEMRRVLSPSGFIRLSTPDLEKYAVGYCDPSEAFFEVHHERLGRMLPSERRPRRKAWMLNQIFYLWGHRWIYDLDELVLAATAAGFPLNAVTQTAYRQGRDPEIAMFDSPIRNDESLYVEIANLPP